MGKKKKNKQPDNTIALNKKARFEYKFLEEFEAGVSLEGWEVKACREGKAQLVDSYVMLKNGEAYLYGANITPLLSASTHVTPDPRRLRKLLLHKHELNKMIGAVERKGHTLAALAMYWVRGKAKLKMAIVEGKKAHDKRATIKDREWSRDKQRLLKNSHR